jgi:hypothetical protein
VIVPVRDRRKLLVELLDGLAAQTYQDFEVIVVDDGSTDGSGEEAAARTDLDLRVIRLDGRGAVAARAAGVGQSGAEILAFTDSDCVPQPGWLAAGVEAVDAGADVVQGVTRPRRPPRPLERTVYASREDGLYATCNVFYRRRAYDAAGGFDRRAAGRLGFRPNSRAQGLGFGEDTLLGWRVRRAGRSAFVPAAIVEHEVFPPDVVDSMSRAWMAGAFPALVREVPELRSTLLSHRTLLDPDRIGLYVGALGTILGQRTLGAVGLTWWLGRRALDARKRPGASGALVTFLANLALDTTSATALVAGSLRSRTVVL